MPTKSRQLQIRVTPEQKADLERLARAARMDLSSYVLSRVLPRARAEIARIVGGLLDESDRRFALAELNDLLSGMSTPELVEALASAPPEMSDLSPLDRNYVAAMVEQACGEHGVAAPSWARNVVPLEEPYFAAPLRSLRLQLLHSSPVPFKRRNIFVDSSLRARV